GKEYSLNQIPVPDLHANLQERQIGGLGWHLIRHYMTQIVYKRIKDNNVLYLFKEKQGEHYASNTE
ncbi:MAG: hypothetical protein U1C33_08400, partial [Candidatus Cloacimonadaceae bacterium]|nr:hypothetical protein [Candidatus Cloacimonadaceae bacterium]